MAEKSSTTSKKSAPKKKPARAASRDAIAVLKADHRTVSELFEKFSGLGVRAHKTREATVARIITELSVHAGIEETVLYPAVRDRFAASDEPQVLEALEEHHLVKSVLRELEGMSSTDERYTAKVTVLQELVDHHVEEEEQELFKQVRQEFTRSELVQLGEDLTTARATAPTHPHPGAPDAPPENVLANAVTAPLDAANDLAAKAADTVRDALS